MSRVISVTSIRPDRNLVTGPGHHLPSIVRFRRLAGSTSPPPTTAARGAVAYNRAWITSTADVDGYHLAGADGRSRADRPRRLVCSIRPACTAHSDARATTDSIGTVLVVTTDQLPGYEIRQILGEVVSSMARTRNPYREGVKNLRGGAYDPMAPDNLTR